MFLRQRAVLRRRLVGRWKQRLPNQKCMDTIRAQSLENVNVTSSKDAPSEKGSQATRLCDKSERASATTITTTQLESSEFNDRSVSHNDDNDFTLNGNSKRDDGIHGKISLESAMVLDEELSVSSIFSDGSEDENGDKIREVDININDYAATDAAYAYAFNEGDDSSMESFEREYKKMKQTERELEQQRQHLQRRLDRPIHHNHRREGGSSVVSMFQKFFPDWLLFEAHHSPFVMLKVVLICFGHAIVNDFVQTSSRVIYYETFVGSIVGSYRLYVAMQTLLGLCLLRLNGNLFHFMDRAELKVVKSELHRRLRTGRLDARFMASLQGTLTSSLINLVGFYMVYTGASHFYGPELYAKFWKWFMSWYLKIRNEAVAHIPNATSTLVFYDEFDYEYDGEAAGAREAEHSTCLILKDHVPEKVRWIFWYCCTDVFQEWRLVDLMYQIFSFGVVTSLLYAMGTNILTIED